MSCPHFREGYFGICVAPNAVHVPSITEMEKFCFRVRYENCPNLACIEVLKEAEMSSNLLDDSYDTDGNGSAGLVGRTGIINRRGDMYVKHVSPSKRDREH